jgi:photosystem II stability/assembly factor-like uncharacterized protein
MNVLKLMVVAGLLLVGASEARVKTRNTGESRLVLRTQFGQDRRGGEQMRAFNPFESLQNQVSSQIKPQDLQGQWRSLGPAPLNCNGIEQIGTCSGRVTTIAIDPSDGKTWLIGKPLGGIWRTTDGGNSWNSTPTSQSNLPIGVIKYSPSNPSIVYAGTGDPATFFNDAATGIGVLKSVDGGQTWNRLAGSAALSGTFFYDLSVDPKNSDAVVAGTAKGVFSSSDGGTTWSNVLDGSGTAVATNPQNFKQQYVGVGDFLGGDPKRKANGLYRSTDTGKTWTGITGPWSDGDMAQMGAGEISMAISPVDPNVVYVSIADAYNGVGNDGELLDVFKTTNAWAENPTWVSLNARGLYKENATDETADGNGSAIVIKEFDFGQTSFCNGQCAYDNVLLASPVDKDTFYAGGISLFKHNGKRWQVLSDSYGIYGKDPVNDPGEVHPDWHALAMTNEGRLIVGNDGGIYSSPTPDNYVYGAPNSNNFVSHNRGISSIQYYYGSIHPKTRDLVLGGAQDNGTSLGGILPEAWNSVSGGDGIDNAISTSFDNSGATSAQGLIIYRQKNGVGGYVSNNIDLSTAPFVARFEQCATDNSIYLAGTDRLWRSNNFFNAAKASEVAWSSNSLRLTLRSGGRANYISAIAFSPLDKTCNTYAYSSADGRIYLTTNGGLAWRTISGGALPRRWIEQLQFDDSDRNKLYVTTNGFNFQTTSTPGHVFITENLSSSTPTWKNISPTIKGQDGKLIEVDLPMQAIAVDSASDRIFVGTMFGVWASNDAGATWEAYGPAQGIPNIAVYDLALNRDNNQLAAFTYGRGAYMLDLPAVYGKVAALAGANPPAMLQAAAKGSKDVTATQLTLKPKSSGSDLVSVTVKAEGSGLDDKDISQVRLINDTNENGIADKDEVELAKGSFASDNGSLSLRLAASLPLSSNTTMLVAVSFNDRLASSAGGVVMGIAGLGLLLAAARRSRRLQYGALALGAMLVLAACSTPPQPQVDTTHERSYKITVTGIETRSPVATNVVTGLPIEGSTIVVKP